MWISVTKEMAAALGTESLVPYGWSEDQRKWRSEFQVHLSNLTKTQCKAFRTLLARAESVRGVRARLDDIDRWLEVLDGEAVKARKVKGWESLLKQYLKPVPRHWVYERRKHADVYQPYYVSGIAYHPPTTDRWGNRIPDYVTMALVWEEQGKIHTTHEKFEREDVVGMTVQRALAERGYLAETPSLYAAHRANCDRYDAIFDKVGRQFLAFGVGEPEYERTRYWWDRQVNIHLDKDGVPSRVVVDVRAEGDEKEASDNQSRPSGQFWEREGCDFEGSEDDDDKDIKPGDEDPDDPATISLPEIPLAPSLKVFDLRRHMRLSVYVDQLVDYPYDADMADKLILPDEVRGLVDLLVSHRGGFRDIVGNKGQGAVILCAGPPGTGKTLTSEVYAEAMGRPLYSVQCSQLGTDPDHLEQELLKVFARAARWNAILLLDECDVYVAARGRDLEQNAIVGVFLRTLEYYAGVLFMTTNRADLVDDAVASRCLARIDYAVPSPADQARIWGVLTNTAGVPMSDAEIAATVKENPGLSGRDVKNLLKLASMVAAARGGGVTAKMVKYVRRFKPTCDPTASDPSR
jgi:hypothetical protein